MLRTLFSARLVALHLLAIGALVVCGLLGRWQLGVFEDSGKPRSLLDPPAVAVAELTTPGTRVTVDAIGRRVTARGTFDASRQLLVAGRDGGLWVLTALDLGDGTAVPVVRGRVATAQDPATAVPEGGVTVSGRLQASEETDSVQRRPRELPQGQVLTVSSAELINLWRGTKLRNGFVVAASQSPAPAVPIQAVSVPPPTEPGGLTWRNLAYAAQWWIFGLFAVFMWWHFVRDALRGRTEGPAGSATDPGPETTGPGTTRPETAGPGTAGAETAGPGTAGPETAGSGTEPASSAPRARAAP